MPKYSAVRIPADTRDAIEQLRVVLGDQEGKVPSCGNVVERAVLSFLKNTRISGAPKRQVEKALKGTRRQLADLSEIQVRKLVDLLIGLLLTLDEPEKSGKTPGTPEVRRIIQTLMDDVEDFLPQKRGKKKK